MASKKIDPELLRAMMMGEYSPPDSNDLAEDWTDNDLHTKKEGKNNFETVQQQLHKCLRVLDKAIVAGKKELTIIHGKGSGALRDLVHKELKKHPQVRNFELSEKNKGQTIVRLK